MTTWCIPVMGSVAIYAETEDEAQDIFDEMSDADVLAELEWGNWYSEDDDDENE
jgi:hypothetical protein